MQHIKIPDSHVHHLSFSFRLHDQHQLHLLWHACYPAERTGEHRRSNYPGWLVRPEQRWHSAHFGSRHDQRLRHVHHGYEEFQYHAGPVLGGVVAAAARFAARAAVGCRHVHRRGLRPWQQGDQTGEL